jgi:type I restriction enzyme S subunit
MKRLKDAAKVNSDVLSEDTAPGWSLQYLDIGNVDSVGHILAVEEVTFERAPSRARRRVGDGDTIISTVRTYLKAIAFIAGPPDNLIASTGFAVLRPSDSLYPKFLWRMLQSLNFIDAVVSHSEGVSYPAISPTKLAGLPVWIPPMTEQQAIVRFLDQETAKIDALVAKKERLIELLQEKRAALITRGVTKGLDPNVAMKDSGVEWLGMIPTHWQVRKVKEASKLQTGITLGKRYDGERLTLRPYLRVANVQDGYLDLEEITEIEVPASDVWRHELQRGDVLMTEGGDFDKLGRGYVWEGQIPGCLHQNHIFAVRPTKGVLESHFLTLVMNSHYGRGYFTATSKQSTNLASTNSTKLRNFPIPFPDPPEQEEIVNWVRLQVGRIDRLIAKIREGIEKLKEHRTALISAAVTGKIDVREDVPRGG